MKEIHDAEIIHRDIKMENFVFDQENKIYLIDFGLAKRYFKKSEGGHVDAEQTKSVFGTHRYLSVNVLENQRASRKWSINICKGKILFFLCKILYLYLVKINF